MRSWRAWVFATAVCCVQAGAVAEEKKSNSADELGLGTYPAITCSKNDNLYVVYENLPPGSKAQNILFRSCAAGQSEKKRVWSAPFNVSHTTGFSSNPAAACSPNGHINVVWRDTTLDKKNPDIFFISSKDNGKTWGSMVNVSSTPGNASEPSIAAGSDNSLHVVWRDTSEAATNPEIYYSFSKDGGNTWSKSENLSRTPGYSSHPVIVVGSDEIVHAAWLDTSKSEGHADVFYSFKKAGKWHKPIAIGHTDGSSSRVGLGAQEGGKAIISWTAKSVKEHVSDILVVRSDQLGQFGEAKNVSNTKGKSSDSSICANANGQVAVVWSDTDTGAEKPNIMGRLSIDGGNDFSRIIDFEKTDDMSRRPRATICGGAVYVVWEESDGVRGRIDLVKREIAK